MIQFLIGAAQGMIIVHAAVELNIPALVSVILWFSLHYYHIVNGHYKPTTA